jgi:hypothetical protein
MHCFKELGMTMNTRQRLYRFAKERRTYVALSRTLYGYPPRAKSRVIGGSNMAGFVSALLGCGLTLTLFSAIDAMLLNHIKSVHSLTTDDILARLISTFLG